MNEDKNKRLREAVEEWVEKKLIPYIADESTDCDKEGNYKETKPGKEPLSLSCPFYMGITEEYEARTKKSRVMIIGQEARHYGLWKENRNDFGYKPDESQAWAIEYLLCQLKMPKANSRFNHEYNKSRFWHTFRTLNDNDINVCWNNVDKVYYSRGNHEYKGTLTYEGEEYLSAQYGSDKKSLLQREIEIADPDALLFVTGPTYYKSMAIAFGVSPEKLEGKLDKDNNRIVDITTELSTPIPAYWTYHPANRLEINSAKEFLAKYKE